MPADTTGVVTVNVSMAAVTLTDANGGLVFSSADPRVHYVELSIAPNSGSHTLTVQRLPGEALATVEIGSQADLTIAATTQDVLVDTRATGAQQPQQHTLSLDTTHPADQVSLDVQPDTTGLVTASFPGATASSQLTDSSGLLIATSSRDVDGYNLVLDGGRYDLSVQANAANGSIAANVSVTSSDQFTLLGAPQAAAVPAAAQSVPMAPNCTATVAISSVNLRSGPGTGYSILNAGLQGNQYAVGGLNPEQNWVVVGLSDGSSAWVSRDLTQMNGDCGQLPVFNIPLRDAPAAAPVVVQVMPSSPSVSSSTSSYHEDEHEGDHHESESEHHDSGEHEDD